jgi:hypothetical protein
MATGAIAKVATATPSSAAERSIEVALMDIAGLLEHILRDTARTPIHMLFRSPRDLSVLAAKFRHFLSVLAAKFRHLMSTVQVSRTGHQSWRKTKY